MLIKQKLQSALNAGLKDLYEKQAAKATSGDENEDPNVVIAQIANDMAKIFADAIDDYIKSGDVIVGPSNIAVTCAAPGSPGVVAPINPAKIS